MSDSVRPHRRQPTRLRRPWDSPGRNTGVGCHFLLQCMKVKSESEVAQSYLTLCNPMDRSPPGSSIHGIFQARYWSGLPLPSLSQGHSRSLIPSLISVESLVTLVEQILSAFSQFPNESIYSVRVCVYFQLHYRFIMSSKRQSYLPSILTTIT